MKVGNGLKSRTFQPVRWCDCHDSIFNAEYLEHVFVTHSSAQHWKYWKNFFLRVFWKIDRSLSGLALPEQASTVSHGDQTGVTPSVPIPPDSQHLSTWPAVSHCCPRPALVAIHILETLLLATVRHQAVESLCKSLRWVEGEDTQAPGCHWDRERSWL